MFSLFAQIFFSEIQIFLVIYTDFVLDHSGKSDAHQLFSFMTQPDRGGE